MKNQRINFNDIEWDNTSKDTSIKGRPVYALEGSITAENRKVLLLVFEAAEPETDNIEYYI